MARHEQAEPFDKLKAGARRMARHEQAEPFGKLKAGARRMVPEVVQSPESDRV